MREAINSNGALQLSGWTLPKGSQSQRLRLLAEVLAEEAAVLPAKTKVDKTVLERLAEVDRVLLPGFAVMVEGRAGVCLAVLSRTLVVELGDRREVVNAGHVLVDSADLRWTSPSPTEKARLLAGRRGRANQLRSRRTTARKAAGFS